MSAKVQNEHPSYVRWKEEWQVCRDTISGQRDIHAARETYLSKLKGMDEDEYEAFVKRARFLNAMQRTVQGLSGLVMRKEPYITGAFEDFQVDASGMTIEQYMIGVISEILSVGRGGTFIDFPVTPENVSVAQAERMALQPTWSYYPAEDILNWKKNDQGVFTMVVLRERYLEDNTDEFATEESERYRVLDLDPNKGFKYRIRVFNGTGATQESEIWPQMNGHFMDAIPFVEHGTFKPPLMDIADNNIQHYRLSADHNHGLHFVALPTPYITGVSVDEAPSEIGPSALWVLENSEASVGLLEFEGKGLSSIKEELAAIEKNMAQLGARMLSDMTMMSDETATAATIRNSAETSALSTTVVRLNEDFKNIVMISLMWMGEAPATVSAEGDNGSGDDVNLVRYNTDFTPMKLDPALLTALMTTYNQGGITLETLIENLQAGEIVATDVTPEEYAESLSMETPPAVQQALDIEAASAGDEDDEDDSDDDDDDGGPIPDGDDV